MFFYEGAVAKMDGYPGYLRNLENGTLKQTAEALMAELEDCTIMLDLQKEGCHNINLVSPSHYVSQIVAAVLHAAENGLHIPLVYNTSGYDKKTTLERISGLIDIYMPDFKYARSETGEQLS